MRKLLLLLPLFLLLQGCPDSGGSSTDAAAPILSTPTPSPKANEPVTTAPVVVATPTPSPTATPTATPSPTPTATPTPSPTPSLGGTIVISTPTPAPTATPSPTPSPTPVPLNCVSSGFSEVLPNGQYTGHAVFSVFCTGGNLGSTIIELDMQLIVIGNYFTPFELKSVVITNDPTRVCLSGWYADTTKSTDSNLPFSNRCTSHVYEDDGVKLGEGTFNGPM